MNSSETEEDARVGLDEVAEQAEGQVGDHEEFEGVAGEEWIKGTPCRGGSAVGVQGILRLRRAFATRNLGSAQDDNSAKDWNQSDEEDNFVELGGMARDAVAEVDGPGERGGGAVGVVGEAGEEAADAPDGDANSEGDGVEVASGLAESDVALHEFDGDEAEDEGANNGLAAHEVGGIVEVVPGELGVFEPEEEFGTEGGSGYGGGDDGPTDGSGDGIAEAAAEPEVDAEGDEVGESLEEDVGMD